MADAETVHWTTMIYRVFGPFWTQPFALRLGIAALVGAVLMPLVSECARLALQPKSTTVTTSEPKEHLAAGSKKKAQAATGRLAFHVESSGPVSSTQQSGGVTAGAIGSVTQGPAKDEQ